MRSALRFAIDFDGPVHLHIGPHKTGTTAIQLFCDRNYEALAEAGVLYPLAGRRTSERRWIMHHPLFLAAIRGRDAELADHLAALEEEIAARRPRALLFSSETLARETLDETPFRRLIAAFPRAERRWILLLRRQDGLLRSRYVEEVRRMLLRWPQGLRDLDDPKYLDHRLRLETLRARVGRDAIAPLSFELARGDLTGAFLGAIGVTPEPGWAAAERVNESLPWRTVALLRRTNALPRPLARRAHRLALRATAALRRRGLGALLEGRDPLGEAEARRVVAQYRASNEEVARRWFGGAEIGLW
jgi:hypothetical protein